MFRCLVFLAVAAAAVTASPPQGLHQNKHRQSKKQTVTSKRDADGIKISHNSTGATCDVDARMDLPGVNAPVILVQTRSGEWVLAGPSKRTATSSYLELGGKPLLLACPGERNNLVLDSQLVPSVHATCVSSNGVNQFMINGKLQKIDQVKCVERVTPYEFDTRRRCNRDGRFLKLGYMINNEIHDLITTCHRVKDGATYYSSHILDGAGLPLSGSGGKRKDDAGRPMFSIRNQDLFKGFPAGFYYFVSNQIKVLTDAMGKSAAEAIFSPRESRFFSKGHFTPNADFVPNTWRDVTFLFVNVQPQWQAINGGNWNNLEMAVRSSAAVSGKKYQVITGAAGNLKLVDKNLYLDIPHRKMPVPEMYTKLVRDVQGKKCIGFIANNFPVNSAPTQKCQNICSANQWPTFPNPEKEGYVYCCSYEEFKVHFSRNIPTVDCSGGVLQFGK